MAYQNPLSFHARTLALVVLTSVMSVSAFAQWQWVDNTGRKVFSDTAPPPGIPEKSILKRPGTQIQQPARNNSEVSSEQEATAAKPLTPKPATSDPQLEENRKKREATEAAKRKLEEERVAKIRAEHCSQARKAQATLDSGIRMATVNDKGEREIMDDKARAVERTRLAGVVQSECTPLPQAVE